MSEELTLLLKELVGKYNELVEEYDKDCSKVDKSIVQLKQPIFGQIPSLLMQVYRA